jgi:hypothetical protein
MSGKRASVPDGRCWPPQSLVEAFRAFQRPNPETAATGPSLRLLIVNRPRRPWDADWLKLAADWHDTASGHNSRLLSRVQPQRLTQKGTDQ